MSSWNQLIYEEESTNYYLKYKDQSQLSTMIIVLVNWVIWSCVQ